MTVRQSEKLNRFTPLGAQTFRLEQRCRRCGVSSAVEVEGIPEALAATGPADGQRAARRSAVVSSLLAPCVACGKRGFWGVPLSALLATPAGIVGAVVAAALALPFGASSPHVLEAAVCGGLLALGFGSGLRLGQADGRVHR